MKIGTGTGFIPINLTMETPEEVSVVIAALRQAAINITDRGVANRILDDAVDYLSEWDINEDYMKYKFKEYVARVKKRTRK